MSDASPVKDTERRFARSAFEKYTVELHRFLLRRIRRPADADDLVQEVFMRLLRMDQADRVRKPLAYLYGIAFHVVREFQMKEEQDRVICDSSTLEQLTEHPGDLSNDDFADRLHLQRQLSKALLQLPPGQRAVLLLVKRDGLSHEEAARVAGLTVQTVEKYVVNAKARLKSMDWDF